MEELDKNNPDLWKWGFYYNPKDPSLRPYDPSLHRATFNFGHKRAALVITLFFLVILAFAGYVAFTWN